jgi:predicted protein tyrosine phosphatase
MYVEVVPGLFLGDRYAPREADFDLVVNCTRNIRFPEPSERNGGAGTARVRVEVDDVGEMSDVIALEREMPSLVALVSKALARSERVLVHCNMGRQRSCAVVAACVMHVSNVDRETAVSTLKEKKPDAFFPDVNFREAIVRVSIES